MGSETDYLKNKMREIKSEYDKTSNEVSTLFNDEHVSKEIFPNLPNSIHSLISRLLDANAVLVQWNDALIRYCDIIESGEKQLGSVIVPQIVENGSLMMGKKPDESEPILEQAEPKEKRRKVKNVNDRTAKELSDKEKQSIISLHTTGKPYKDIVDTFHLKNIWVVKHVIDELAKPKTAKRKSQKELAKLKHAKKTKIAKPKN